MPKSGGGRRGADSSTWHVTKSYQMNPDALRPLAPDLRRVAPRSPLAPLGSEHPALLARVLDKCLAVLLGQNGPYHYNCGLDRRYFKLTGVDAEALRAFVATGADDQAVAAWARAHGSVPPEQAAARLRGFRRNPLLRLLDLDDWLHARRHRG